MSAGNARCIRGLLVELNASPITLALMDDIIEKLSAPIHLTITETEPAAWQRYDEGLGWSPVDESYAKTLAAAGVTVRRLYPAERHVALVEKLSRMRLGSELSAMGFPGLAHEGVFAAIDAVIVEARALAPLGEE